MYSIEDGREFNSKKIARYDEKDTRPQKLLHRIASYYRNVRLFAVQLSNSQVIRSAVGAY